MKHFFNEQGLGQEGKRTPPDVFGMRIPNWEKTVELASICNNGRQVLLKGVQAAAIRQRPE